MGRGIFYRSWWCFLLFLTSTAYPLELRGKRISNYTEIHKRAQKHLQTYFRAYDLYETNTSRIQKLSKRSVNVSKLKIQLDTLSWDLTLDSSDSRSSGYLLRNSTSNGILSHPRTKIDVYRGFKGDGTGGCARITLSSEGVTGFIKDKDSMVFMEPLRHFDRSADPGVVIVYSADDVKEIANLDYENDYEITPAVREMEGLSMHKRRAGNAVEPCRVAEVAIAADYSMYEAYGSIEAVEGRLVSIMNMVNELYTDPRINIEHEIVEIFVETADNNTWGSSLNFSGNRDALEKWAQGPNGFAHDYDITILWWYLRGGGTVGQSSIAAVCDKSRNSICVRDFTSSASTMMLDEAHELAHMWGAVHVNGRQYLLYPTILGDNDEWDAGNIARIVKHKNSRNCLVSCERAPEAAFTVMDTNSCKGNVSFIDNSKYNPTEWLWDFGDGTSSKEQHPVHGYTKNGTYTVSLNVKNPYGENTTTITNFITINAAAPPVINPPSCANGKLNLTASGNQTIKWYDTIAGGVPIYVGNTFQAPAPTENITYYAENGSPEFEIHQVGPVDTSEGGNGAYKEDHGSVWMRFTTQKDLRFRSVTVYSNKAGKRHFILTTENLSKTVYELVEDIPVGKQVVHFNWELQANKTYELVLEYSTNETENPEGYIHNLYRSRANVSYPQTVESLFSVTTNYWRIRHPNEGGWYIGYDWRVQEINPCASARKTISINPMCTPVELSVSQHKEDIIVKGSRIYLPGSIVSKSESVDLAIYNMAGQKLWMKTIAAKKTKTISGIGFPDMASGAYIFSLQALGKKYMEKVIIP